jgi:hypothetical protein
MCFVGFKSCKQIGRYMPIGPPKAPESLFV